MDRILFILPNLDLGGTETVVMNYFRNVNRNEIIFDFVVHGESGYYEEEARELGARIFRVPTRKQGFFKNIRAMRKIYKEEKYSSVVICTEHAFAFIELFVAWTAGIKMRAAWSHFSDYQGKSRLKRQLHFFARPLMRLFANRHLACTKEAGQWLFGKFDSYVINNAIDMEKYTFSPTTRQKMRENLAIENKFVVGIAGRITAVKNHAFALDVFKAVSEMDKNAVFIIIGDGELRDEIEKAAHAAFFRRTKCGAPPKAAERKWALPTVARGLGGVAPIGDGNCESSFLANKAKTAQHGISEITIFTGMVSNIYDYFQAVDVLLIPSFHEGFPVIAIEAQASSLPVILSDTISAEGKISELAHFESLKSGASAWAKKVLEIKNSVQERTAIDLSHSGFHIKTEAEKLQRILKK